VATGKTSADTSSRNHLPSLLRKVRIRNRIRILKLSERFKYDSKFPLTFLWYKPGFGRIRNFFTIQIQILITPFGHKIPIYLRKCTITCLKSSLIALFIPDPNFSIPVPGSKRLRSPDPDRHNSIFNPKNYFLALGNMIRDVHPGSGS
jgi:hypothetical protein